MADKDFVARVHALPRELFAAIVDLTFAVEGGTVLIKRGTHRLPDGDSGAKYNSCSAYQFPAQLHINKATRQAFAEAYYSNTVFKFHNLTGTAFWVHLIGEEYRAKLSSVVLITDVCCVSVDEANLERFFGTWRVVTSKGWMFVCLPSSV